MRVVQKKWRKVENAQFFIVKFFNKQILQNLVLGPLLKNSAILQQNTRDYTCLRLLVLARYFARFYFPPFLSNEVLFNFNPFNFKRNFVVF